MFWVCRFHVQDATEEEAGTFRALRWFVGDRIFFIAIHFHLSHPFQVHSCRSDQQNLGLWRFCFGQWTTRIYIWCRSSFFGRIIPATQGTLTPLRVSQDSIWASLIHVYEDKSYPFDRAHVIARTVSGSWASISGCHGEWWVMAATTTGWYMLSHGHSSNGQCMVRR